MRGSRFGRTVVGRRGTGAGGETGQSGAGQQTGEVVGRGRQRWLRRAVLAAALAVVAFVPGQAPSTPASSCHAPRCGDMGAVRWIRPLPGSWVAATSVLGTVPAAQAGPGQAYAAAGKSVAAVGVGMTVYAYRARDGQALWTTRLAGFPAGSQIVSVRVWTGVVTVGVARAPHATRASHATRAPRTTRAPHATRASRTTRAPHATPASRPTRASRATGAGSPRVTASAQSAVVLSAGGGRQLRTFPAAPFGGVIAANSQETVVIGPASVTSHDNGTGQVNWRRAAGSPTPAWQRAGDYLYLTQATGGPLGSRPVTTLRRINLGTGSEQDIRARDGAFAGRLSTVLDGVLLFSGGQGVTAYSAGTGTRLWRRAGAVPESVDMVSVLFYLTVGSTLTAVQPWTGQVEVKVTGASSSGSGGIYGVRNGVALGLDQGPAGQAWGYDVAGQRVIWNTRVLPWPHYFVDLSGIGGSADPGSDTVILTACAQRIQSGAQQICQRPELVLINR
jgi:outer membrane protein assembly factor BamB